MRKFTKPDLPREHERWFWQGVRAGLSVDEAAAQAGASWSWGRRIFVRLGGVNPTRTTDPLDRRYLRFEEREEIMRLQASGLGVRAIARETARQEVEFTAQASLVSAWIELSPGGVVAYYLRNASALPVHDVKVIGLLDRRTREKRTREMLGEVELSTLPPSVDPIVEHIGGADAHRLGPVADSAARAAGIAPRCTLEFTDSAARRWIRYPSGELVVDPNYESTRGWGA